MFELIACLPEETVPAVTPSDLLAWAEADPTFGSAASLADEIDPAALDPNEQVRLLQLAARLEAQACALRVATVAAIAGPAPSTESQRAEDFADCEVAAALRLSVNAARHQVEVARWLHRHLPATREALARGDIGYVQAMVVAEETWSLDPALLPQVEDLVLRRAAQQSPGQTRVAVRKAVARVDPERLAAHEAAARTVTDVRVVPGSDGTSGIYAEAVPAVEAAIVAAALDGYARGRKAQGDQRTLGQLRAAGLAEMATRYLTGAGAPTSHGRPITVQVTIDLPTLLGLTDHPAEVTGGSLIPADVARALLADARLRRLITDPATGHLLDYGRKTYRVPPDLAAAIAARYVTTTGPGSTARATTGDRDHDRPWNAGGRTTWDNLHPPGRRFHGAKTRGGWRTTICPCGTVTWMSPRGAGYRTHPHDYRLGP